jgi:hypothetical protein
MAEGRSNTAIARQLAVSDAATAKHVNNILAKLDVPPAADDRPTSPRRTRLPSGLAERPENPGLRGTQTRLPITVNAVRAHRP